MLFGSHSKSAPTGVAATDRERALSEMKGKAGATRRALDDMCMESSFQMGSDELTARANCYNDPEAKEALQKHYEREESVRNFTSAKKISRIELLIFQDQAANAVQDQPFSLRLRLWDQDGKPASSEGSVTFTISPDDAVFGGMRETHIYANNALIAHIADEDIDLPIYEFSGFQVQKERLDGATEIEITATFADSLEASAHYSITYAKEESTDPSS